MILFEASHECGNYWSVNLGELSSSQGYPHKFLQNSNILKWRSVLQIFPVTPRLLLSIWPVKPVDNILVDSTNPPFQHGDHDAPLLLFFSILIHNL